MSILKTKLMIAKSYQENKEDIFELNETVFEFIHEEDDEVFRMTAEAQNDVILFSYYPINSSTPCEAAILQKDGELTLLNTGKSHVYKLDDEHERRGILLSVISHCIAVALEGSPKEVTLFPWVSTIVRKHFSSKDTVSLYIYQSKMDSNREKEMLFIMNNAKTINFISQKREVRCHFGLEKELQKMKITGAAGVGMKAKRFLDIPNKDELDAKIQDIILKYISHDLFDDMESIHKEVFKLLY